MTDYDAGSVVTGLAGDFDRLAFDQFEAAIRHADELRAEATLKGDFDHREIDEFERTIKRLQAQKVETELRANIKGLKTDVAEADRIVAQYERRRAQASQDEIRSSAAYLREARKRRDALQAEAADRDRLLKATREEGRLLAATAKLHGDSARASRDNARAIRSVESAANDGGRALDNHRRATDRLGGSTGRLARSFDRLLPGLNFGTRIPVYKLVAIGTAIASIIPPVVALGGALGPVVGLLGALPTLALTGIGALVTGMLGLRGVGAAVSDAWGLQTKAANSAIQTGKQALAASRATRNAEQALADANRAARQAQDDLNDSRQDAARRLEDMRIAARRARLEEENSILSLRDAREELARLEAAGGTAREIEEARQRIKDAEIDVVDSKTQSKRATTDLNEVEKQGIERMDEVVRAHDALRDATRNVVRQQEDLADAADKASLALETGSSAASALQVSMANLSPAGRDFVRFIRSDIFPLFKRLRNEAQEGLLPGVEEGMRGAERNFPVLERMVKGYSDALGDAATQQGRLLGGKTVGRDLDDIFGQGERLIRKTAEATFLWERGLIHVGVAAEPLIDWFGDINVELATMFEHWAEQGRETGKLEQFFHRTIRSVELTVEALWDFGRGIINIGTIAARVWGNDLLRDINDVAEKFRDWTESVRGAREIESYFVRWRRRWHDISDAVSEVVTRYRELRREGEKPFDAATEALAEAFSRALPKIAENVANTVPNIVEAFVQGFLHANQWGKLIIGGWLIAKLGGFKAFTAIGVRAGAFLGIGISEGAAAGVAGTAAATGGAAAAGGGLLGLIRGKVLPIAKRAGIAGLGIAVADVFLQEWDRRITQKGPDMFEALKAAQGPKPFGLDLFGGETKLPLLGTGPNLLGDTMLKESEQAARRLLPVLEAIAKQSKAISPARARELKEEIAKLDNVSRPVRRELNRLVDTAEERFTDGRDATRKWNTAVETMVRDSQGKFAGMRTNVEFNTRLIKEALRDNSGKGRDALAKNLWDVVDVIKRTMRRGGEITDKGMSLIKQLYVNELRFYGLSPAHALAGANIRPIGGNAPEVPGGTRRQDPVLNPGAQASGGYAGRPAALFGGGVVGRLGERGRDLVHAILGRGEAVLNFPQQKIVNRALRAAGIGGLPALYNRTRGTKHYMATGGIAGAYENVPDAGSFQGGGFLELLHPFNDPAEHGDHLHIAMQSIPALVRLGHWLQRHGWLVSEQPSFGGVNFRHADNSYHYSGHAIDVNWPNAGQEKEMIRRLLPMLGAIAPAAAEKLKRVIVRGERSPLKGMIQGLLDHVRRGAQRRLEGALSVSAMPGSIDLAGGPVPRQIWEFMQERGFSDPQAGGWLGVLQKESNFSTTVGNRAGSGATGLAQWLGGRLSALKAHDNWTSLRTQLNFIWEELMGSEGAAYSAIKGTTTPEGAAYVIDSQYERSDNILNAPQLARAWYEKYAGMAGGGFAGGDGASIADFLPSMGGLATGAFVLPPEGAVNPSGLLSGSGTGWTRSTHQVINRLDDQIEDLGSTYTLTNRRFQLTDEEFINEGTDTTPPSLNQAAIAQRLAELEELMRIRQEIIDKYNRLVNYIRNLLIVYRQMRRRLAGSIERTQNALKRLKGRRGREARRSRNALNERLAEYTGAYEGAGQQITDLEPRLDTAEFEFESAKIDLEELRAEAVPLRGGGAGLTLPDWEPPGLSADQTAIADQERRRADAAVAEAASLRAGFQAFAGPGDLGSGGFTARDAVLNPTGVPGPGYVVGPGGELIPVVSGESGKDRSVWTARTSSKDEGPTYIFQSLFPYTKEQARQAGAAASEGIDAQAPAISSRTEVTL